MTKIQLSAEEMQLVRNTEWILTKHRIITKVYDIFGGLAAVQQQWMNGTPQHWMGKLSPKIAKGEQYAEMPYVVLDYPRIFSKTDVLAVRVFFWWGHYFSIGLHLKGRYFSALMPALRSALNDGRLSGAFFSVQGDEFSFDLDSSEYVTAAVAQMALENGTGSFFKISYRIGFEEWETVGDKLAGHFRELMEMVEMLTQ